MKRYDNFNENIEIIDTYKDDGLSAFKNRPNFDKMLADIDKYDGIIISELSRIGRSLKQLLEIVDDLKEKNKQFIVIKENLDTTTPQGKLMLQIIGAFNEYEASIIRERMSWGRHRYKMEGGKLGRKPIPVDPELTDRKLKSLYVNKKIGMGTIVNMYGGTVRTIRNRLVDLGIEIRKPKGRD